MLFSKGWGNRKGQVWLELRRSQAREDKWITVSKMKPDHFGVAPHEWETLNGRLTENDELVKLAQPGDYFQVMKSIGGGGGHRLQINKCKLTIFFKTLHFQVNER